jgi:hypothetical protein
MTMKRFAGWASAEEFAAWEEQNFQRDKEAVLRAYQAQRMQRPLVQFPWWLLLLSASAAGLGFVWLVFQVVAAVGDWLQSWVPWLR